MMTLKRVGFIVVFQRFKLIQYHSCCSGRIHTTISRKVTVHGILAFYSEIGLLTTDKNAVDRKRKWRNFNPEEKSVWHKHLTTDRYP